MLKCARELFNLEDHIHYLNNSYMSPNLKSVEVAGIIGVRRKTRPYLMTSSDFFEPLQELKKSFADLVGCPQYLDIAIVPSASYGLANVAANLEIGKKKNIVIPAEQFPSNYYVWERLASENNLELRIISPPSESVGRSKTWNQTILDAIDADTLLLACANVHWSDGTLFDLEAFRHACTKVDAYLIVDGSQSIGALPFDITKIKPDALVCVGYKWLFGPYGIGFAYYGEKLLGGLPIEENWANRSKSDDFKNLVAYQSEYRAGASKFTAGESSNFIAVPMMQTALDQVKAWTPAALQEYSGNLIEDYLNAFRSMGCFIEEEAGRCKHLLGVRLPDYMDASVLGTRLRDKNVFVSVRGNSIRLATSVYNSRRDMDQFLSVIHQSEMA